jgi:quercetin dioxygenase-like cupin family protein
VQIADSSSRAGHFGVGREDPHWFVRGTSDEPECRLVLISMQPSQSIPERALLGTVAMYVFRGSISVSVGNVSCDIHACELCTIEDGIVYQIEANEHSALLVMSTGTARVPVDETEELDVNELPFVEPNRIIASICSGYLSIQWSASIAVRVSPFARWRRSMRKVIFPISGTDL